MKETTKLPDYVHQITVCYESGTAVAYTDKLNFNKYLDRRNYIFWSTPEEVPEPVDKGSKYQVTIRNRHTGESIQVDVYDVLEAFKINCSAMAHAIKKFLMAGKRGHKDFNKDCDEGINSVEQSKLLQKYR